jgi:hypothetical protein
MDMDNAGRFRDNDLEGSEGCSHSNLWQHCYFLLEYLHQSAPLELEMISWRGQPLNALSQLPAGQYKLS